jgi:cobalt-zinc-cadmium efflux system protein
VTIDAPADHGHRHPHATVPSGDRRRLLAALLLILGLMAGEVVVGLLSHSLALLSDAGHMLTDAAAIALGLVAIHLAATAPGGVFTYGLKRVEILSALINGATLAVLVVWVTVEAVGRLLHPPAVGGGAVVITALAGIGVNLLAAWQLSLANRDSLNLRATFRHVLTDLFAFIGTAIAGGIIVLTGFVRADAIASLVVAGLMAHAAYGLLRDAGRSLLEAAPEGLDPEEIGRALVDHPHVASVHDLHVWEITSGFSALSAHVLVHPGDDCHGIRRELELLLHDRFGVEHTTLQVDHENDPLVHLSSLPPRARPRDRSGS